MPSVNGNAVLPPLEVTVYGDPLDDRELSATVLRVQQRRRTLVAIKRHRDAGERINRSARAACHRRQGASRNRKGFCMSKSLSAAISAILDAVNSGDVQDALPREVRTALNQRCRELIDATLAANEKQRQYCSTYNQRRENAIREFESDPLVRRSEFYLRNSKELLLTFRHGYLAAEEQAMKLLDDTTQACELQVQR
jgi:hypothetical protein